MLELGQAAAPVVALLVDERGLPVHLVVFVVFVDEGRQPFAGPHLCGLPLGCWGLAGFECLAPRHGRTQASWTSKCFFGFFLWRRYRSTLLPQGLGRPSLQIRARGLFGDACQYVGRVQRGGAFLRVVCHDATQEAPRVVHPAFAFQAAEVHFHDPLHHGAVVGVGVTWKHAQRLV